MSEKIARILIIEDEDDVRESYQDMFEFFGYEVDSAPNGREGVVKVTNNDFDIVITDLNMPEMDGIEVLKVIKKNKPYIEVIVITGYATLENAIKAMKIGAYDYFTKPIDLEHVKIVLAKCVQSIKARKENEELKGLNRKLTELNELKDKFITITNHELRTPITVLKGYLELIDYFLEGKRNGDLDDALGVASETMAELVTIVEQMHDMTSLEIGKGKLQYIEIDFLKLIKTIYREMKIFFSKRNIDLNLDFKGPAVIVKGDINRLKRSIRELMQNALKFTAENGEVKVEYSVKEANKSILLKVIDSGIGIPIEKQNLIFEPFYEVQDAINHMTSKTEFMGGGIGLGLTLAKEIFESHEGALLVESEEKKGSTFIAVLPYERILSNNQ